MSWPWNPDQWSFKVIEGGTIQYIAYGFLLVFNTNFAPKMHRFWNIRLQKRRDLENWVTGPLTSLERSPYDRSHTATYWRSIVTMAVCRVVSELFNDGKFRDLEIWVKGHSRSLRVVSFDRLYIISC